MPAEALYKIYMIINRLNGREEVYRRVEDHWFRANTGAGRGDFYDGLRSLGREGFFWRELTVCYSEKEAATCECALIAAHGTMVGSGGYNIHRGGVGSYMIDNGLVPGNQKFEQALANGWKPLRTPWTREYRAAFLRKKNAAHWEKPGVREEFAKRQSERMAARKRSKIIARIFA